MKFSVKIIFLTIVIALLGTVCDAKQTKIVVAPASIQTPNSSSGIYPDISYTVANDIINELNKNLLFNTPDIRSTENLITSEGMQAEYKKFLTNYKDRGIIDYKFCNLLKKKAGVDKIILVTSGFSMQDMVIKQSKLYYVFGYTEFNPINSYYTLDVQIKLVDTQSGLEEYVQSFNKNIKVKNFEIPSNSLNDNFISTNKIKKFSQKIALKTTEQVLIQDYYSAFSNVSSDVVMSSNKGLQTYSTDGANKTRDGRPFSPAKNSSRESNFKNWVREGFSF